MIWGSQHASYSYLYDGFFCAIVGISNWSDTSELVWIELQLINSMCNSCSTAFWGHFLNSETSLRKHQSLLPMHWEVLCRHYLIFTHWKIMNRVSLVFIYVEMKQIGKHLNERCVGCFLIGRQLLWLDIDSHCFCFSTLVQSLQKMKGRKGSMWKMKKDGKVDEGRTRLWSTVPAIVALGQSGASGQDFLRDLIGGQFNEIDIATVCQLRCAEKVFWTVPRNK